MAWKKNDEMMVSYSLLLLSSTKGTAIAAFGKYRYTVAVHRSTKSLAPSAKALAE